MSALNSLTAVDDILAGVLFFFLDNSVILLRGLVLKSPRSRSHSFANTNTQNEAKIGEQARLGLGKRRSQPAIVDAV